MHSVIKNESWEVEDEQIPSKSLTIDHADWTLGVVSFLAPSAPCVKSMFFCPGGSVVERANLKGFHGKAPPRVEFLVSYDSTTGNLTRSRHRKGCQIDRPFLILWVVVPGLCSLVE